MTRYGPQHYRSNLISPHDFKPGDEVDYYFDRHERSTVQAVVVNVTAKRIVIKVRTEKRHRSIRPENLSKRAS